MAPHPPEEIARLVGAVGLKPMRGRGRQAFCRVLRVFGAACLAAAALASGAAQAQAPEYRFSPVNQFGIQRTAAYWNPILAYVAERSGVKLQLKLGRTSAETTAHVLEQQVEFVFTNHLFSPEREQLGWRVFGRRDAPAIHAQIVVPADSPVARLEELAGMAVAFPGPEALTGYKLGYAHLLQQKIDVSVVFAGNMDAALLQMFGGKVAAAGGNSQLLEAFARREGWQYRVLWSSEPLHDLALMASARVAEKDLEAVAKAFFAMAGDAQGRQVLRAASQAVGLAGEAGFVPSDGSEYEPVRRFLRTAPARLR
jgi:phosphonate transport system substrate-binding protein